MGSRWSYSREKFMRVTKSGTKRRTLLSCVFVALFALATVPRAAAGGDAPQWMHSLVGIQLPTYDEKTSAVLLYSETNVAVLSENKIQKHVREAYKILRPEGRKYGTVEVDFSPSKKINSFRAWCIPAQGKDYEVKDKEAIDVAAPAEGGYLFEDTKYKVLRIPAPDPGNIIGYEYDVEEQPFWLQDIWHFQEPEPVRESHYSLQIPPGWVFKASWLGHEEVKPSESSGNQLQWAVSDVKGIRPEMDMPPWRGLAAQMIVSFFPSGGTSRKNEFASWEGMGSWYQNLVSDRMNASDAIKQKVNSLTAGTTATLAKMQAIAAFMQHDIRYVAISLGIGGWQPHAAPDVFTHRYGDCKDKATLMRTMLREVGLQSYHVVINHERGAVTRDMPAHHGFDHVIVAIKLPDDVKDSSLIATMQHPKLGRILFF